MDAKKYKVPEEFPHKEAHELFVKPDVADSKELEAQLKWKKADEEAVIQFMCNEKNFQLERIQKGLDRLKKSKAKGQQKRLENFFGAATITKRKKPASKVKGKGGSKKNKKAAPKKKTKKKHTF